jgi:hypothetical protein
MALAIIRNRCTKLLPLIVVIAMGLASVPAAAQSNDGQSAAETEALNNYRFATAAGRHAEASKYVLDYMEQSER